jgi:hypothetical protein
MQQPGIVNPEVAPEDEIDIGFDPVVQTDNELSQSSDASQKHDPEPDPYFSLEELGQPFPPGRMGYTINQPFFARLWGTNRIAFYDQALGTFYHYVQARGLFEPLRENEIRTLSSHRDPKWLWGC